MDQQQIDRVEWENPRNWTGPIWLGAYCSKNDSRTWVPQRLTGMGWTLNLGRKAGVLWLLGILGGICLLAILGTLLGNSGG
ncbi:hypothetical protein GW813_04215 [bacterium]|nr:hypothetical protein [bacterium]PJA74760.1 MAG: hypothetical protein CO151_08500 [bacterium CG_4_9_14_3_um_filter_65_15]